MWIGQLGTNGGPKHKQNKMAERNTLEPTLVRANGIDVNLVPRKKTTREKVCAQDTESISHSKAIVLRIAFGENQGEIGMHENMGKMIRKKVEEYIEVDSKRRAKWLHGIQVES